MIWHICFVSLTHLFEIQLFSSSPTYSNSYQNVYLSWTDKTYQQLFIELNRTSNKYIDQCDQKLEYDIATCLLVKDHFPQQYKCQTVKPYDLQYRYKRQVDDKSKRTSHVSSIFIIGISCFVIGIIVGIAFTIYITMRKQRYEKENLSDKTDTRLKSLPINNEMTSELRQTKTKPPVNLFSITQPSIRRERDIPDNTLVTLDRYKMLPNQSPKREQISMQRPALSNLAYMKSAVTFGNQSTSKGPMKQLYTTSKNANYKTKCYSRRQYTFRSKSC
ncbi:hypothetical protein I4U23_019256 [Adineta vaga]|nr:hypothetical protein I4U23_019256 [Adineta vaga]